MMNDDYTLDELLAVCIARQVQDGEIWAQGINTPLVAAGLILARCTHAPTVAFASAIGQGICVGWGPLAVAGIEALWLERGLIYPGFGVVVAELLPAFRPKEFFRPGQVDAQGNTNNIAFGRDHSRPRMRLPGSGGIPDVSVHYGDSYLYVPRHSRVIFAEKPDYVSGLGHHPSRTMGSGPRYLVSDLGQFDWYEGRMRLTHCHPGVTPEQVQKKTGFPLEVTPDWQVTAPPTAEELHLLRGVIDPLGVRRLETLGGSARKTLLRQILDMEAQNARGPA